MKRYLLSVALGTGIALSVLAVPAKRGNRTFTQSDGKQITVSLVGDERFHSFVTTDGLTVERADDNSDFYYVTPAGRTAVLAHNLGERTAEEANFLATANSELSVAKLAAARLAAEPARAKSLAHVPAKKSSQVPSKGSPRIPVLLVAYKDVKFKDGDNALSTFQSFFSEGDVSAHQYFYDQSNGKYSPQFDVYGPITLTKNRSSYGGNNSAGNDKGVGTMVGEACSGLDESIDFSKYDNDGDGECDVVIVLYAGVGEASSDVSNAVWPCQWELASSDYGKSLTLDKVKVNKFAVFNELYGDGSKVDGIGTVCHEFSHCLDLPDFYDTNYGPHFGMAHWSLLDYGCYNNDGYLPIGYSAYEKSFMGWIELQEAQENTKYTLPVFNKKSADTDVAIKVTNKANSNEYYVLENRAQQGWDTYMPTEGMLITHVTYLASAWSGNTVNDYDLQRMTPIPADNSLKLNKTSYFGTTYYDVDEDDLLGDLWPYGNATELTNTSTPAAKVNTGTYMSKPITEITRNTDGSISFWAMKADLPLLTAPTLNGAIDIEPTAFTASWDDVANSAIDGVTYTLEVTEHRDVYYELVSETDFTVKSNDWESDGYTTYSASVWRLGSSNNIGSLTSPAFTTDDTGVVTVVLNAKYYSSDGSSVKVSLLNAAGSYVDSKTVSLSDSFNDYVFVLSATAHEKYSVKIESVANKKRVELANAKIYTGDASSVVSSAAKAPAEVGDASSRTITGITGNSYTVSGLNEYGSYDFRIKAVPSDNKSYNESEWSDRQTVILATSGIENVDANTNVDAPNAVYFDLQGRQVNVNNLTPGIYVRRIGNSTSKIIVK
jgi:M6 family metalloprotease-like protein